MAQKPMLRAEVYAHAMRASQNRKKEVRGEVLLRFAYIYQPYYLPYFSFVISLK
jgi:hypothetical protein